MYYYKQEFNTIPGIPFIFADDTHMTSMKIIQFLRPPYPPCPTMSKILLPP